MYGEVLTKCHACLGSKGSSLMGRRRLRPHRFLGQMEWALRSIRVHDLVEYEDAAQPYLPTYDDVSGARTTDQGSRLCRD